MNRSRLLSLFFFLAAAAALQAQVTVYVYEPPGLEGPLDFTWASDWGQTPNLNDTANNVTAYACLVNDGSAADSLGCDTPLFNASELAGKIAVVYRGTCEFGRKALNAQGAGAVAVIIINNVAGAPVGMGAGAVGAQVTIPVVMISQDAGAALRPYLDSCAANIFIGSQTGFYANNLALSKTEVLVPRMAQTNSLIASSATEFYVPLGAMVHNYGSNTMDNSTVQVTVVKDGNTVYDQSSSGASILPGDSLYVTLPDFSQNGYQNGQYNITYTVQGTNPDDFPSNNSIPLTLTIGDKLSYAPSDATTGLPISGLHAVPGANTAGFVSCIAFKDANASRLAATGLWFSASRAVDTVLTDEIMFVYLYQWTDAITGPTTLPSATGLVTLTSTEYSFPSDLNNVPIYVPYTDVITLENDQWYMACLESYSGIVRHGWDNSLSYDLLQANITLEPNSALMDKATGSGTTWYNGFTGITGTPSLALQVIDVNTIGIAEQDNEVQVTPYPNPTTDVVRIPVKGFTGTTALQIFDSRGALVNEQRTAVGGDGTLTVDVSTLSAGTYQFSMQFENGQHTSFKVQVNK